VLDPLILARAVHLAASAVMTGALIFDVAIARPLAPGGRLYRSGAARLIWIAAALAFASGVAWLLLVSAAIDGRPPGQALSDGTVTVVLTGTRFGHVWLVRGVLLAIAMLAFALQRERVALAASATAIALIAITAHAGAREGAFGWALLASDMLHLLAASAWFGSLPSLALLLLSNDIAPEHRAVATRRFSAMGIVAVAALMASGLVNAYAMLGQPSALVETGYGRILALKLSLFVAMLACAALNRVYWTPRLPTPAALGAIVRLSLIETALGLGIMLVVAVLGTLDPPVQMHRVMGGAAQANPPPIERKLPNNSG
jgi:putative copper resistance protein D